MATVNLYNHTAGLIGDGLVVDTNTFFVTLLNASATFDATDTTLSDVTSTGANEVSGNGWSAGGVEITNPTTGLADTNKWIMDGDDISVAITGGDLGPFLSYVVWMDDSVSEIPLFHVLLDAEVTVLENNAAEIEWSVAGIITLTGGA